MDSRSQQIMDSITLALGKDARYFDICMSEILVDDPDVLSVLVNFSPKTDLDLEDTTIAGSDICLQFDLIDDNPQLILGEDDEFEITKGQLYAALYWGEVCKCKSDAHPQQQPSHPEPAADTARPVQRPLCLKCNGTGYFPVGSSCLCDHQVATLNAEQQPAQQLAEALENLVSTIRYAPNGAATIKAIQAADKALAAQQQPAQPIPTGERLRSALNRAIELLVTALHEPEQITEEEIHYLRTIEIETRPPAPGGHS